MTIEVNRTLVAASLVTAVLLLVADSADAGRRDHVRCQRVDDAAEITIAADVATALAQAGAGCVLRGGALRVCAPVDAAAAGAVSRSDPAGIEDATQRACYRLECPPAQPASVQVTDRFGTRPVTVKQPRVVCVATGQD